MAPAAHKRASRARQPLTVTAPPSDQNQLLPNIVEIFNNSQHVTSSETTLNQLKKLYKNTEYRHFEGPFKDCVKKLLQSKQSIYFKTSCDFLCKFLQHLSKLSDEIKAKERGMLENADPNKRLSRSSLASDSSRVPKRRRQLQPKRTQKRAKADVSDDELVANLMSTSEVSVQADSTTDDDSIILDSSPSKKRRSGAPAQTDNPIITDHDRIVSSCIDVADHYMQVANEDCRHNAVYFICKFLSYVESLDEEICDALKTTLPKRIRDRKPMIRAQAVLASRTFQDNKMTQDGFLHHFYRDPELVVRKALLQIMDTKVFGFGFLVDSTQDGHEQMRKAAFQRLGKISACDLDSNQLHRVIHNGLNERGRQASYAFKTFTLEPWLSSLYDGIDLHQLLQSFDLINYYDDVCRLLELIYEKNSDEVLNNGTSTKLHHVVEAFRERWLYDRDLCLPTLEKIDEKVTTIWLTMVKFCKANQAIIKPIRVRTLNQEENLNQSLEKILDSQENDDEVTELYERLTPDLVNLIDFLKRFVYFADDAIRKKETDTARLELIYQQVIESVSAREIGDELERKTVQEVLGLILKENLLTSKFKNFIPPIIKCLFTLIYSSSSNLMINYISEIINDVRSQLEDLASSSTQHQQATPISHATNVKAAQDPKSAKKVRIDSQVKRGSYISDVDQQNLEFRIANIRVEVQELKDTYEGCLAKKDFDQAKVVDQKLSDLLAELTLLHGRRFSIASDVSHMSMVVETGPGGGKLSSTRIGDVSMDESNSSIQDKQDLRIFKHHMNELIKCLQMYYGCLQNVKVSTVPFTMRNHLNHLSLECLEDWFKDDARVMSIMIACNGVTALLDEEFAKEHTTITLLFASCYHSGSIEIRTVAFKSLVDIMCQHDDLDIPMNGLEKFLCSSLRDYGKHNPSDIKKNELEFITALIEGTAKLFYLQKLSAPEVLAHLILWWYHPRTHSKLKQFIGIFLPTFVNDVSKMQGPEENSWLKDLLSATFVVSIEYLHDYILGPGFNIMAASDMHSLINFLCNLIPVSFHSRAIDEVDRRMDDLPESSKDLMEYLKQSKNSLKPLV